LSQVVRELGILDTYYTAGDRSTISYHIPHPIG